LGSPYQSIHISSDTDNDGLYTVNAVFIVLRDYQLDYSFVLDYQPYNYTLNLNSHSEEILIRLTSIRISWFHILRNCNYNYLKI